MAGAYLVFTALVAWFLGHGFGRHLLEEADRSLYRAKSGGRNRIGA